MTDLFAPLDEDTYKPTQLKESLAQYDNYQIYTLVCVDRSYTTTQQKYYQTGYYGLVAVLDPVTHAANLVPYDPIETTNTNSESKFGSWLAIQTFSPIKVKINFLDYVNTYHD